MTNEEYDNEISVIEDERLRKIREIKRRCIRENARYKVGDIIASSDAIIKVDAVRCSAWSNYPIPVYVGYRLTKKFKPFKNPTVNNISERDVLKLIK